MIILDTSTWIEFFKSHPPYFQIIRELTEAQQVLAIECVFSELLQEARNKKERELLREYWDVMPKAVEDEIWIEAGIYASANKLISKGVGLIDSALIVAAQKNNALIWTLDKKLNSVLPKNVKYTV